MLSRIRRADIAILSLETEPYVASSAVKEADLVVDAVYGIGFHGRCRTTCAPFSVWSTAAGASPSPSTYPAG